jgi:hypothetical protein
MARIRTIKPELWSDVQFGECSTNARLLFVASLNFADDRGNLARSARQLQAQVFPYDGIDCEPLIDELCRVGLFIEYAADGKKFIHIKNFEKHQRIDRPGPAKCPVYEPSMSIQRTFDESSASPRRPFDPVREGKGREGKGKDPDTDSSHIRASQKAASRLSADWTMTEALAAYATEQGLDPMRTAADFRDYWTAASGAKARKHDWEATWRMWCRNAASRSPGPRGLARQFPRARSAAEIEADIAKESRHANQ